MAQSFITVSKARSGEAVCCQNSNLKTCYLATVDSTVLGSKKLTLPGGASAAFLNNIGDNCNAYHYGGNKTDVIITFNPKTGGMHGHAMMSDGRSFTLEYCGKQGHVWKEIDVANLEESKGVDLENEFNKVNARAARDIHIVQGQIDKFTMVTYSVKFYYTPEFAAATPDIEGFLDQVIAETNQGYKNSLVPLQVAKYCSEKATINDNYDANFILTNFQNMKGTLEELRGSADAAVLLVNSTNLCGTAYFDTLRSGKTLSVVAKSCAVGLYVFGHEVGHNIGLAHDPATERNKVYPYGHGHLIAQGSAGTGYITILAYGAPGHSTRINYYSNPSVIYPPTGTPTGVEGLSNNAAVLIRNRFILAAVGNESADCNGNHLLAGYERNLMDEVETTHIMETECNKKCFNN